MAPRKPPDAIRLLKDDHERIRALLASLTESRPGRRREDLFARVAMELHVHTTIEERLFYPAFREAAQNQEDRRLLFEAIDEHALIDQVVDALRSFRGDDDHYVAKAKLLEDLVLHHAEEEEKELFPHARKAITAAALNELGVRMAAMKAEMQDRPARREHEASQVWQLATRAVAWLSPRG